MLFFSVEAGGRNGATAVTDVFGRMEAWSYDFRHPPPVLLVPGVMRGMICLGSRPPELPRGGETSPSLPAGTEFKEGVS